MINNLTYLLDLKRIFTEDLFLNSEESSDLLRISLKNKSCKNDLLTEELLNLLFQTEDCLLIQCILSQEVV